MMTPSQSESSTMIDRVAPELSTSYECRLGEIVGFVRGDGCVEKESGNGVSFANAEPAVLKRILDDFEKTFGTCADDFNFYLTVGKNIHKRKTADFWKKYLTLGSLIVYEDPRTKKPYGWMKAHFSNKEIRAKIIRQLKKIETEDEHDAAVLLGFLRGFFAAEGAVIPGKEHKEVPNSIQFPQKGKKFPMLISRILSRFGISSRVVLKHKKADYYCANITAFENFEKFFRLGMADLHPEKKRRIQTGLSSYKSKPTRKNIVSARLLHLLEESGKTRHEIYECMQRSRQQVNMMLYSKNSCLMRNKLISKEIGEDGIARWNITSAGKNFLRKVAASEPPSF